MIKFTLPYYEKGIKKYKFIEIKFVSLWVIDKFNKFISDIYNVQAAFEQLTDIQDFIDRKKTPKKDKEILEKEKTIVENQIYEFGKNNYLEERFETIKQMLVDNGYENDYELMDYDWWYKHVDRKEIKRLLEECAFKDIPKDEEGEKKKKK